MEKTARKPSADSAQERLRQNKAVWNKEVSTFINDLIHFKKMMNGWPSKFYKERSRITRPIPADPATIIGSLAGDFQELTTRGNGLVQERLEYVKNRRQKQPKQLNLPLGQPTATPATTTPEAPKVDLTKQLSLPTVAFQETELIKLASDMEYKYELEVMASNPFSRFITRLFNPKFGFGEGARIRRLRMSMLDNCVKSYKELKKLHKEIIKSSKGSIITSHKMMTLIWNYWNAVNRLLSTYKAIRPDAIVQDEGGQIETDPELKREKALEDGRDPDGEQEPSLEGKEQALNKASLKAAAVFLSQLQDYKTVSNSFINVKSLAFRELHSIMEAVMAAPKNKKTEVLLSFNVSNVYNKALQEVGAELGISGSSFQDLSNQLRLKPTIDTTKQAQLQRWLGKTRHQILPGATSGQRLEIYRFISQLKKDLNNVMDLLEKGFDQEQLTTIVGQVNREMTQLRTMMRSLYYSEKPEEASSPFF